MRNKYFSKLFSILLTTFMLLGIFAVPPATAAAYAPGTHNAGDIAATHAIMDGNKLNRNAKPRASANSPLYGKAWAANDGLDFHNFIDHQLYFGIYDHAAWFPDFTIFYSSTTLGVPKYEGTARPVLWDVMYEETNGGNLALVSHYTLDAHAFNEIPQSGKVNTDYTKSDLRSWLNGDFYDQLFRTWEKNAIPTVKVTVGTYQYDRRDFTPVSKTTIEDKVYLPSPGHGWSSSDLVNMRRPHNFGVLRRDFEILYDRDLFLWARGSQTNTNHAPRVDEPQGNVVRVHFGIEPIVQLDSSKVVYAQEITTSNENYRILKTYKVYKLTVVSKNVELSNLTANGNSIQNKGHIAPTGSALEIKGNGKNHDALAYKIIGTIDGARTIVQYGVGNKTSLNISLEKLKPGKEYIVYVWAQKNHEINSHEASAPIGFTVVAPK